ncbi:hypothetical protein LguiB_027185 [Lonicera macranthoides]
MAVQFSSSTKCNWFLQDLIQARPSKSLWVGGIGPSVLKEELEAQFIKFGKIEDLKFFRDRNTAFVDYFGLEDACQALKIMNGTQIGDGQIRVDFLRSHPSRREHGRAWEGQFSSKSMGPLDSPWMPQQHSKSLGGLEGDGQPSNVLCISYPPTVHIDEQMLHNAMILFGEIEGIRSVPLRHCSYVEFRSVEEARRAKEGLQGKLFNDPRILITYSNSELAPSKDYPGFYPGINGPRPGMFLNEIPFRPPQIDLFNHNQSMIPNNFPGHLPLRGIVGPDMLTRPLGPQGNFEPLLPHAEFNNLDKHGKLQNTNPSSPMGGPNLKRSAPPLPSMSPSIRPMSGNWDVFNANQLQRESKRSRTEDPPFSFNQIDDRGLGLNQVRGVGPQVDGVDLRPLVNVQAKNNRISPVDTSGGVTRGSPGLDYVWRGVIAKGGTPVCCARCVPIGEGIGSEIPDVVNCSARTGLDMLTKHYADAVGFEIIFFLPDSEEDFAPFTEFLRYLGAKNRAGVAKFDDGTTLFLVPPSDFLTKVLNVAGPERLYGVVLKFHQHAPSRKSVQSSPRHQYIDRSHITPQTEYNLNPRESVLQIDSQEGSKSHAKVHGLPSGESLPMHAGPPSNTASISQAGVTLTPELIATLASFLPAKEKLHVSTPAVPDRQLSQGWQNDRNAPEPMGRPMQRVGSQFNSQLHAYQNDYIAPEHPAQTGHQLQQLGSQFNPQHQAYQNDHNAPVQNGHQLEQLGSQFNPRAQFEAYQNISPTLTQRNTTTEQIRDHAYNTTQHVAFSSRPSNKFPSPSQSGQFGAYPQVNQQYHLETKQDNNKSSYGGDAFGLYSPSNPDTSSSNNQIHDGANVSQLRSVNNTVDNNAEKSNLELPNQVQQQLQSALYGAGPSTSRPEVDKNELYKSTLQFAANLLLQVQQQQQQQQQQPAQGTQAGQGSGNH